MTEEISKKTVAIDVWGCDDCGTLDSGSRILCPSCFGSNRSPKKVPGEGNLVTWTTIRKPPSGFDADGAYIVAIVNLDAGLHVSGRLIAESDEPSAQERVRAVNNSHQATVTFERIHQ